MITVTLNFTTIAEAAAALAAFAGGSVPGATVAAIGATPTPAPEPEKGKRGKAAAASTASAPAVSADPSTAAATPAESPAPAPAAEVLAYPPIGERIAGAVAQTNPRNAYNRAQLKALFATLVHKDGADKPVKTGQDVKPEDRPQLVEVLDKLDAEAKAAPEEMA